MARKATEQDLNGAVGRLNEFLPRPVRLAKWKRRYRVERLNGSYPFSQTWRTASELYDVLWEQIGAIVESQRGQ